MHIVLASIEKVIPTLEDAAVLLRVLARSATGQESSAYTTLNTGPKRPGDLDGPEHYHVVILDNGRSAVLGTEMQDMLRCIRCGACMNHCPVYGAIGGHAYGWVYPGPIGAVLTPQLIGVEEAGNLPNASTFCGRCESVCPGAHPVAQPDAPLARARVRAPSHAQGGAPGPGAVELRGPPAAPLSPPHRARQPRARAVRPGRGPLPHPAAGRRLDALPRLPRAAAGRHVPCPVAAAGDHERRAADRQILDGIRRSLHRGELSGDAPKAVEARLARPPRGPAVARADLAQPEKVALFCQWAEANNATVARVAPAEVAAEVAAYLARNNLPAEAAMAPSPQLAGYDWASQKMLSLRPRPRRGQRPCLDHRRLRRHRRDRHAWSWRPAPSIR